MGADDDSTCVEHVWVTIGVVLKAGESLLVHECTRCETQTWEPVNKSRA